MMKESQIKRLEALKNRATLYECAAIKGDEQVLIAYCYPRSRNTMLKAMRKRGDAVIARLGIGESDMITWPKPASNGAFVNGWNIRFTGRTEREAIQTGELPYIAA